MSETSLVNARREGRAASRSAAILEGRGLRKIYKNGKKEVRAIDGVSLKLAKSSFLAIVGPSGAGKSTLLHLLGGLDTPEAGSVILDGVDLYKISEAKRALARNEKIGFVFQFYHLLPEFTALENVLLPALMKRATSDERRATDKRARDLLKLVGLGERVSHRPAELSGGESQRVAIARALINEPVVLLCDEPTGNLDSKTAKDVMGLLLNLNRERGVSLIIATHDESLKGMAEAVLRIRDGKAID